MSAASTAETRAEATHSLRRFLFVIHYPIFGGPHNQALRLADPLAKRGWDTHVLLPDEPGNAAPRLRGSGMNVVEVPLSRVRFRLDARLHARFARGLVVDTKRLRSLIREMHIDLVLIGGLANPQAGIAAALEGIPVVWQVVDTHAPRILRRRFLPLAMQLGDALMFNGHELLRDHSRSLRTRVPSFIFYPPVDTARFKPSPDTRTAIRNELGVPLDSPVIGTVANLSPPKGVDQFLRAAALIYKSRPDAWFLVAGATYPTHPRYTATVCQTADASGIPRDQLLFLGDRPDVERIYAAMDVKVIASISEGTTTTAMEAMACGTPVVATAVGAVPEVVNHGKTGLLVPPLGTAAMARATLALLEDPDLYTRLAAAGREAATTRFTLASCADTHVAAFEAAIFHKTNRRRSSRRRRQPRHRGA